MMTQDDILRAWAKYKCAPNANGNIRTGPVRLSFPHLFTRQKPMQGQTEGKFGCSLLFPFKLKSPELAPLYKAANEAGTSKWGAKLPAKLKSPFLDAGATSPETEGYDAGMMLIRANSTQQPGCVDRQMRPITDPAVLYAGCWVIATLRAFAYDMDLNKGVSFGLQNVQFFADGEPFGGRSRASDDFETLGDDDPFANGHDADADAFANAQTDAAFN